MNTWKSETIRALRGAYEATQPSNEALATDIRDAINNMLLDLLHQSDQEPANEGNHSGKA